MMADFLFRGSLQNLDPDMAALVDLEALRQARKLIMIPSEATIPEAVREAVGSVLGNIYAEGYPPEEWRFMPPADLLDIDLRLAEFRRDGSPRYYKGTEIAEIVESLARSRTAERFANQRVAANQLYVNVQPLSGAPANSAVYTALAQPGDTILGMNLLHGGHLTHGSPVNRSGLFFNVLSYGVRAEDERLDYDQMRDLALKHRPKFIIAGFTSYPWSPDWNLIREIADEAGSLVLADVSHVAGLIIAGEYPSPVGIADIVSFTTHKTVAGPRGAVLLTHKAELARKLDKAVFPGEQGGPHVNSIAGLAVAMKLAGTEQFHHLQKQIVVNAKVMVETFQESGVRVSYGGTDTHMVLIDVGAIQGADGTPLSGDIAARILDLAGVTANRNTIPGDKSPFRATGLRFGTTWITQRGFKETETRELTRSIADLMLACQPFSYAKAGSSLPVWRARVDFGSFVKAQQIFAHLASSAGIDYEVPTLAKYPKEADAAEEHFRVLPNDDDYSAEWRSIHLYGPDAGRFLEIALSCDVLDMSGKRLTALYMPDGLIITRAVVEKLSDVVYMLYVEDNFDVVLHWLTALSDGYVIFDPEDLHAKVPGPVSVSPMPQVDAMSRIAEVNMNASLLNPSKAYFIGCRGVKVSAAALPLFTWSEPSDAPLKTTPLHRVHQELGAKMTPFAGYDMPVWYSSVTAEHQAVRTGAGIFDVTHMGVFEFAGVGAEIFLNAVTTNDVTALGIGEAHYSYLLGVDGIPLDDIYIYRRAKDNFMVVVNASNNDKNWAWLQAVLAGDVAIDAKRPWITAPLREQVTLRDLRAETSGVDRRVDIALQGPDSLDVLLTHFDLGAGDAARLKKMAWSTFLELQLGDFDVIVSRTGYTGERVAFELFVHPEQAEALFRFLVEDAGVTPCGLAARDSLRIEAGLPLYGHELAGDLGMNPAEAGFAGYVKTWKPFFIGKSAYLAAQADVACVRFQMDVKGLRSPQAGDPIVDTRGRVIGKVTSCAVNAEGQQMGLALVKNAHSKEGASLMIYANAGSLKSDTVWGETNLGGKLPTPQTATVLSRFPKKKK